MRSVQAIIDEAFRTRVLTHRQQQHLDVLLMHQQYSSAELQGLRQLRQALAEGHIVFGSDSLVPMGKSA
ncbi:MAG: hypothetical protein Q6L60_14365 [Thermostichus sp. HHBFW_bins_43]